MSVSPRALWGGRVASGLAVLFLLFDATIKFTSVPAVAEAFARLGYPTELAPAIGALELLCLAAYLVPGAAALGAVALTGFLGGAVATHVRVQDPLFTHVLFPVYVGVLLWGGLWLREARLRALIPVRRSS